MQWYSSQTQRSAHMDQVAGVGTKFLLHIHIICIILNSFIKKQYNVVSKYLHVCTNDTLQFLYPSHHWSVFMPGVFSRWRHIKTKGLFQSFWFQFVIKFNSNISSLIFSWFRRYNVVFLSLHICWFGTFGLGVLNKQKDSTEFVCSVVVAM